MLNLDGVQKADCKGKKTNSLTGTIHSPQETAGEAGGLLALCDTA